MEGNRFDKTMPSSTANDSPTLAAIDIGSNSFRLELGQLERGRYKRLAYIKRVVRLGADLDDAGRLSEAGIQRGLNCLKEFSASLTDLPTAHVRAVATQTLREAANRNEFLERAQGVLGHRIEVISGREEARLIYAGVAFLQPSDKHRLVIDIGGRSTELILGHRRQPLAAESFAVGSVSLSMRYFPEGKLTAEAFRSAQIAAGAEFEEALKTFAADRWQEALGSSGTAGAVSDVLKAEGITDGRITAAALAQLMKKAIEAGDVNQIRMAGLKEDRRPVLPGGLAILYTLMTHFNIRELFPAKGALRQGVIIELNERLQAATRQRQPKDMRDHSVASLQQRFQVDTGQALQVARDALLLYDGVAFGDHLETRRELGWAASLHEIGQFVSNHDHHRHSAYLLTHADAPGFSQSQQRRLAELVLGQRGGLRKLEASLADPVVAWQILCLRLAVVRCHARGEPQGPEWVLTRRTPREALLAWRPAREAPNPRTLHLLNEEVTIWARSGVLQLELPSN
jgi:exopolyphosphatase / guanosine-5'-triphosphate,3'-diphosphate pyrophosphatase